MVLKHQNCLCECLEGLSRDSWILTPRTAFCVPWRVLSARVRFEHLNYLSECSPEGSLQGLDSNIKTDLLSALENLWVWCGGLEWWLAGRFVDKQKRTREPSRQQDYTNLLSSIDGSVDSLQSRLEIPC